MTIDDKEVAEDYMTNNDATETQTPRTKSELLSAFNRYGEAYEDPVVDADFARTLERELTAATAKIELMRVVCVAARKYHDNELYSELVRALDALDAHERKSDS